MRDQRGTVMARVLHDWYTDKWNNEWAEMNEPGWGISGDLAKVFKVLSVDVAAVRKALKKSNRF